MKDLRYDLHQGNLRIATPQTSTSQEVQYAMHMARAEVFNTVHSACHIHQGDDPLTEKEADASPDSEEWHKSKLIKLEGLQDLKCWEYVDRQDVPTGKKIYCGKFVFKKKPPANNLPGKYKARWCISDPKWLQRLSDEVETFSPTVRMESIRHLFAKVVERNWDLIETDIVNAFATSTLPEPVYMEVPKIWQHLFPGKVCKVSGAL